MTPPKQSQSESNEPRSEPVCVEASVSRSVGGKVAIREYGNVTSDYHLSLSRRYTVPEDWTEEQVEEFQLAKSDELRELLEPLDQREHEERFEQSYMS